MSRRSGSSARWRQRQQRDPYVEKALREGWRGRAVFKLEQINAKERILRKGMVCVDLGAAPGSWSQLAAQLVGAQGWVLAQDLLSMDPIAGVEFVPGDFTELATLRAVRQSLGERRADLVMSDMAPNISGNRSIDQPRSMQLADEALLFAEEVLSPGGDFLVKLFQGEGFDAYLQQIRAKFRRTRLIKPKASRAESREIYLLARTYGM